MTATLLLDDHLLLRVLLDDEPRSLRPRGAPIATTGLWYHRLCRALADETVVGSLSRRVGAVNEDAAAAVIASVIDLPDAIALVSLRTLGWPMGDLLRAGTHLNLLSLEAVAAARYLDAEICLAALDSNGPLRAAAPKLSLRVRTIRG